MPLDPTVKAVLDQMAAADQPPIHEQTPAEARAAMGALAAMGQYPDELASITDLSIPGPAGEIPARAYRPQSAEPLPALVYIHGGGWVIGDIESHDSICQQLSTQIPAVVVSVDYRLAPEHPYPAALQDCFAATRWVHGHGSDLGADSSRLAVAGDSAGGNLAALVCVKARDEGGPALAFQLLVYPATDLTNSYPSYEENGEGYLLTKDSMRWFVDHYISEADRKNPDASPMYVEDLSGLPPALVITAEFDPLRDEGEAYAARLREAGVPAIATRYDGMIHAFFGMDRLLPQAVEAVNQAAGALREALHSPATTRASREE
jgi:acetyl esterase